MGINHPKPSTEDGIPLPARRRHTCPHQRLSVDSLGWRGWSETLMATSFVRRASRMIWRFPWMGMHTSAAATAPRLSRAVQPWLDLNLARYGHHAAGGSSHRPLLRLLGILCRFVDICPIAERRSGRILASPC
jgi:hypothetical protein